MLLFPQLPGLAVEKIVRERCSMTLKQLVESANPKERSVEFTPTGGERVRDDALIELRSALVAIAKELGFPSPPNHQHASAFDLRCALVLQERMQISATEASSHGVWTFMSCMLAPDLVHWRFLQNAGSNLSERYFGGRRNTFQRLWWRVYYLGHGASETTTRVADLLAALGEDELVQLAERPRLAGIRGLPVIVGEQLLQAAHRYPTLTRRQLIRECQKRLLRLSAFIAFEALSTEDIARTVSQVFDEVAHANGLVTVPRV